MSASPDAICAVFAEGALEHLELSLPMRVLYHGKVYVLSVSTGQRRGLILTKDTPQDDPTKK